MVEVRDRLLDRVVAVKRLDQAGADDVERYPPGGPHLRAHPREGDATWAVVATEPVALNRASVRALPRDLQAILSRALAVQPSERYASVSALREDVEATIASESLLPELEVPESHRGLAARLDDVGERLHIFGRGRGVDTEGRISAREVHPARQRVGC